MSTDQLLPVIEIRQAIPRSGTGASGRAWNGISVRCEATDPQTGMILGGNIMFFENKYRPLVNYAPGLYLPVIGFREKNGDLICTVDGFSPIKS